MWFFLLKSVSLWWRKSVWLLDIVWHREKMQGIELYSVLVGCSGKMEMMRQCCLWLAYLNHWQQPLLPVSSCPCHSFCLWKLCCSYSIYHVNGPAARIANANCLCFHAPNFFWSVILCQSPQTPDIIPAEQTLQFLINPVMTITVCKGSSQPFSANC